MDKLEFIKLIKLVVADAAVEDTIGELMDPPGRKPANDLRIRSEWFKSLSEHDRDMVQQITSEAVHSSIFGFMCVLDGVRAISDSGESNNLTLTHENTTLNADDNEFLHDLYKNV